MEVLHISQAHNPSKEVRDRKQLKCATIATTSKNKEEAISKIKKKDVGIQQLNQDKEIDTTTANHLNTDKYDNQIRSSSINRNDIREKTNLGAEKYNPREINQSPPFGKACTIEAKGIGHLRVYSVDKNWADKNEVDKNEADAEHHFDIRLTLNSPLVPITLTRGGSEDPFDIVVAKEGNIDTLINGKCLMTPLPNTTPYKLKATGSRAFNMAKLASLV